MLLCSQKEQSFSKGAAILKGAVILKRSSLPQKQQTSSKGEVILKGAVILKRSSFWLPKHEHQTTVGWEKQSKTNLVLASVAHRLFIVKMEISVSIIWTIKSNE